jgi:hypothetical protein
MLQELVQQLANAVQRDAGVGSAMAPLQGQLLQLDFEGDEHGDVLLDMDQLCEELSRRKAT